MVLKGNQRKPILGFSDFEATLLFGNGSGRQNLMRLLLEPVQLLVVLPLSFKVQSDLLVGSVKISRGLLPIWRDDNQGTSSRLQGHDVFNDPLSPDSQLVLFTL